MITAVTTFSPKLWDEIGHAALASWLDCWPGRIVAYHEGEEPDLSHERLTWRNLLEEPEVSEILEWMGRRPALRGMVGENYYRFDYDAHKFSRKVFAIWGAAQTTPSGPLFWLDIDVLMLQRAGESWLRALFAGKSLCYMGRKAKKRYSECSVVGYDLDAPLTREFIDHMRDAYLRGTFLTLEGFHDCYVFDQLVKESRIPAHDLAENVVDTDPMRQTVLASHFKHFKGPKKAMLVEMNQQRERLARVSA